MPIIFIGLIVYGVFYLIRSKKINYFRNKLKKHAPFDDDTQLAETSEMKLYKPKKLDFLDDWNKKKKKFIILYINKKHILLILKLKRLLIIIIIKWI